MPNSTEPVVSQKFVVNIYDNSIKDVRKSSLVFSKMFDELSEAVASVYDANHPWHYQYFLEFVDKVPNSSTYRITHCFSGLIEECTW